MSTQTPCPKRQTQLISTSFSKLEARECLMLTFVRGFAHLQFSPAPPLRISSDCKPWPKLGEDVESGGFPVMQWTAGSLNKNGL